MQPENSGGVQTHWSGGACSEKWEMSAMIIQKTQPAVKAPPGGVVRMIQHVMPGSNLTAQLRINTNAPPPHTLTHTDRKSSAFLAAELRVHIQ